jgi:hypothetical protein
MSRRRQPSTVDLLPVSVRQQLQALLDNPRLSLQQATDIVNATLKELRAAGDPEALDPVCPEEVSRIAVNRYDLKMREVGAKLRQGREVAEAFIARVGAAPQGQMGLLINEMLRGMAFDLSLRLQDADINDPETMTATIDQVKALALAVQRLEQSATINVKREAEIRKQAVEKAAEAASDTAKQAGVSAETIAIIRRDILRMAE